MTRRTSAPAGAPCWIDLLTSDPDSSRRFYSELLGWTAEEPNPEFGGYFMFRKDGVPVAGCMGKQPGMEVPDTWSVHLSVADARRTVAAAAERGAHVIVEPMDVADLGVMSMITDPSGAAIGAWQPGLHQGFGVVYESGAPAWFELHTRAYDECLAFYRDVFGWTTQTMSDTPEFRYTLLLDGETQLAGVMDDSAFPPEGSPSYWLVYLGVDDTDAALARVVELGGSVRRAAEDTPYGRLAAVSDPTGATFNVIGPNTGTAESAPATGTAATSAA
jgi:uncharacterized protein